MNASKKEHDQVWRWGRINRGFHNPTEALAASARPGPACAKDSSALSEASEAMAAARVPQPKELPGRFPGAEPYVSATFYRSR